MITLYRAFLVLMIVMSALMMPEAITLPRDAEYTIGPGFLPLIMLGAIIVCCALLLIFDLKSKSDAKVKKDAYLPRLLIRKHEKVSKINVFKGREHGTKSKISY